MNTRLRIALFLLGTALVLTLTTNARATNYVVDRNDDPPGAFACAPAIPNDCTFRYAMSLAAPSDQVHFAANLVGATITLTNTINLNMPTPNTGPTIIDGTGTNFVTVRFPGGNIFTVFDDNVRNFTGIRFADSSAGFYTSSSSTGSNINLDQVRFENVGMPIRVEFGSVYTLTNSTVAASGTMSNSGYISISGTSFTGGPNRALVSFTNGVIVGSNFSGYHMPDPGGAIYNYGNLTFVNTSFTNNSSAQGGAIYSHPLSTLTIDGGTFSGNQALIGGAICADVATATIKNATFTGNIAGQDGGAIIAGGTIELLNLTVTGNQAARNGGGIDLFHPTPPYLRHLTVYNNAANNSGGGIYVEGASPSFANSIVAANKAGNMFPDTNATALSSLIGGDPKLMPLGNYGGLTQTYAPKCGSPARNAGSVALAVDSTGAALTNDQRGAAFARNANGAVDIGAVEMLYATVTNNLDGAMDAGSLRKAVADAPEFSQVCFDPAYFNVPRTISQNNASLMLDHPVIVEGPGTGLLTLDAHAASRNVTVSQTSGPVYLSDMTLTNGKALFTDPSPFNGAALLVDGFDSSSGGGTLIATDLNITRGTGDGTGVYNKGTLTLSNSTINGFNQGGFFNDGFKTATLDRMSIINNMTVQGAGIANAGTLTVTNSAIRFNTAGYPVGSSGSAPRGGALFNYPGGFLYVKTSLIANNTAQLGGGLYNFGYTEMRNVTMSGNSALQTGNGPTADGGAIYGDGNYVGTSMATIDIYNSTIAGNNAVNAGGGTFMKQIPGNFAVMNFINSIEAINGAAAGPDVSGELISYGYNLIGINDGMTWAPNSPSLAGNIVGTAGSPVNPRFAPFGDYGGPTQLLVLLPNSPAINAGHPTFYEATDQRGSARPAGGRADIGAFERNITIDQGTLINGVRNLPYLNGLGAQLTATRQSSFAPEGRSDKQDDAIMAPMQFAVAPNGGTLPPGLTLSSGGLLSGTPTLAGSFTFSIKATDTDGQSGVQQYVMQIFVPTAAGVSLSGRVTNSTGQALRGVTVILTAPDGSTRTTLSSSFGYYQFNDVESGRTYVVSAATKRYQFEPMVVAASGNLAGLDLVAQAPMQ